MNLHEKTVTLKNPAIKPKGAPEDKARAFDKVNPKTGARPNRSVLKKLAAENEKKFYVLEMGDEGEYIMVLVMQSGVDYDPNYYGVNVLFYPDGKVDASTADKVADKQWANHKSEIIKVARAAMKDPESPMIYDGLGGKEVKRGTGKLSFDPDAKSDYHGYEDKKTNEGKLTFKAFLLAEAKKIKEPGWYVCDHMDKPVSGPMQERGAKEEAAEKNKKHADKRGKGDIDPFSAEYFSDYEIKRMNEGFGDEPDLTRSQKKALLKDFEGWSGGFTPDDCTAAQVREYLTHGISTKFPQGPAKKYLEYIRDNGASNAP
jgi:hypothetical protein